MAKQNAETPVVENPGNAPQAASTDTRDGIDLKDTPLGGVEGDLVVVDAPRGLNLRTGPAISFRPVEVLTDGTLVSVLALPYCAEVPGWALVHTGQHTGWVDIRYLQELKK